MVRELDTAKSVEQASRIAEALGVMGSSWAWASLGAERETEGMAIRKQIAEALVRGFVRFDGREVRKAHRHGISMVAHPATRIIIAQQARSASQALRKQLDALARVIERRAKRRR